MIGPVRLPPAENIVPGTNRAGATLPTNRLVGYGTPSVTGERAITSLDVAGVAKIAGAIQHSILSGEVGDVYDAGDLLLESDGTTTIAVGDRLIAVAGADLATSGRVAKLTGAVAGTNYEIVGEAKTAAAAVAGTQLAVRYRRYTYQG